MVFVDCWSMFFVIGVKLEEVEVIGVGIDWKIGDS